MLYSVYFQTKIVFITVYSKESSLLIVQCLGPSRFFRNQDLFYSYHIVKHLKKRKQIIVRKMYIFEMIVGQPDLVFPTYKTEQ